MLIIQGFAKLLRVVISNLRCWLFKIKHFVWHKSSFFKKVAFLNLHGMSSSSSSVASVSTFPDLSNRWSSKLEISIPRFLRKTTIFEISRFFPPPSFFSTHDFIQPNKTKSVAWKKLVVFSKQKRFQETFAWKKVKNWDARFLLGVIHLNNKKSAPKKLDLKFRWSVLGKFVQKMGSACFAQQESTRPIAKTSWVLILQGDELSFLFLSFQFCAPSLVPYRCSALRIFIIKLEVKRVSWAHKLRKGFILHCQK